MAFATTDDVAARRGRDLSEDETVKAAALCEAATAVIASAADKDDAWADALNPVPKILKIVCVELVNRTMANPDTLRSASEQLGAYQHSASFRDLGGDLFLTPTEEQLVRRAVRGTTSASSLVESVLDDIYDATYGTGCGS